MVDVPTYVRGIIFHTQFAESYHSLLKRGIIGTFHHVSDKHLRAISLSLIAAGTPAKRRMASGLSTLSKPFMASV